MKDLTEFCYNTKDFLSSINPKSLQIKQTKPLIHYSSVGCRSVAVSGPLETRYCNTVLGTETDLPDLYLASF